MTSFDEKYAALKIVEELNVLSVLKLCDKVGLRECSKAIIKHSIDGKVLLNLNESTLQSWRKEISDRQAKMLQIFVRNLKQDPGRFLADDTDTYEDVDSLIASQQNDRQQNFEKNRKRWPQKVLREIQKFHNDRNFASSDQSSNDVGEPLYQEPNLVKAPLVHKNSISKPINNGYVKNILKKQRKISTSSDVESNNPTSPLLKRCNASKSIDDLRVVESPRIHPRKHGSVTELNNNHNFTDEDRSFQTKMTDFKIHRSNTLPLNHMPETKSRRKFNNNFVSSSHYDVPIRLHSTPNSPKRELPPIPKEKENVGYPVLLKSNDAIMEQEMQSLKDEEERMKREVNLAQMQSEKLTKNLHEIQSRINEGRVQIWQIEENQLQMREAECRICVASSYHRRPKLFYRVFQTVCTILKEYWILTMVILMLLSVFLSITVLSSVRS